MGRQKRVKAHLRKKPHSRKQVRVKGHLRVKRTHYKQIENGLRKKNHEKEKIILKINLIKTNKWHEKRKKERRRDKFMIIISF